MSKAGSFASGAVPGEEEYLELSDFLGAQRTKYDELRTTYREKQRVLKALEAECERYSGMGFMQQPVVRCASTTREQARALWTRRACSERLYISPVHFVVVVPHLRQGKKPTPEIQSLVAG